MVSLVIDENLRLILQTAESARMDDTVPVTLEPRAGVAFKLNVNPPFALIRAAGKTASGIAQ